MATRKNQEDNGILNGEDLTKLIKPSEIHMVSPKGWARGLWLRRYYMPKEGEGALKQNEWIRLNVLGVKGRRTLVKRRSAWSHDVTCGAGSTWAVVSFGR